MDGRTRILEPGDFEIRVLDNWKSPHSEAVYPSKWQIEIPSERLVLDLAPRIEDQELRVSITYWEGAVAVDGTRNGEAVFGHGYVELTGYAGSIAGRF
jgi:predicted secreted hydrolase